MFLLIAIEMPFGVSPVLEVDGTKISGSVNILRYLGEKFGENIFMHYIDQIYVVVAEEPPGRKVSYQLVDNYV